MEQGEVCSSSEVEESKALLRLIPIWATSLIYAVVLAQSFTLFTKQGATMDRSITTGLEIPVFHKHFNKPNVTVPMSVWWLAPQYSLYGLSDVFVFVGLQEFFYDQMPKELRSVGIAIYLSVIGVGSFLSSILIYVIEKVSGDGDGWFADNLNRAHLDYFYWLLAALCAVGLVLYIYSTKSYIYIARGTML
ncbi:hypothetical protein GQ457_11G011340 [Hibiscus cannabinus]